MEQKAKVTSEGQVTIPTAVRRASGVRKGGSLVFEVGDGEARVRAVREPGGFADVTYRPSRVGAAAEPEARALLGR